MSATQLATDITRLRNDETPLQIFCDLRERYDGDKFLLESVEGTAKTARYSFIGFDPIATFKAKGQDVEITRGEVTEHIEGNPVTHLRELLRSYHIGRVGILPFSEGLVGYLSYDFVRYLERLPTYNPDTLSLPEAYLIMPRQLICVDHLSKKTYLITHGREGLEDLEFRGKSEPGPVRIGGCRPWMSRESYEDSVNKAKQYIVDGDIFQAVLSLRYDARLKGDPLALYEALRHVNPSPYQYYLEFKDTQIAGSSPEMLVRLENGTLVTRPLAGTRPRGDDIEKDEKLRVEMLLDEKERAEHLMLVDLARNDLGRVSTYGSVVVDELMETEKYSHVQHMVSNVTSRIRPDMDSIDAFRAVFPAGTVSGAPKVRAMEIIEELEPARRGPYAGTVGYFDFRGNMDLAIAIRTMFTTPGRLHLQAGSGIVFDSEAEREYQECQNKLRALYAAIGGEMG